MSDSKVRKVGTIRLGGRDYDLALNGEGLLALEEPDIYGRPAARRVWLQGAAGLEPTANAERWDVLAQERWEALAQELLTLLAQTMVERDAALASLQKGH